VGLAAIVASVAIGGDVAYGAWSVTGAGSGAGDAITAKAVTVTAVVPGSSGDSLYPGAPAGWVYLTITNSNPYAVNITGLSWGTPVSNNPTAYLSSNISVDAAAPTSLSIPVAAGATTRALQINGVLDLAHAALDGGQGATFTVPVTVSGAQN
jgi:hypothetical protein